MAGQSFGLAAEAWRALFIVGCIIFAEPLTSTLLFPFVYFMVRDFSGDPAWIGFRVGLITSTFFLCQLLTTPIWGWFSDRFGRRPTFIIGLLGGTVSMALFGLSHSLAWAVLSRSVSGLLNGNLGVARTCLGEIAAKYGIKRSKAFSVFGMCGALGYIVGPIIGGMLSKPAETLGIRGPHDIFVEFPFLLPCLVSCGLNLAIALVAAFGLEETLQSSQTETPSATEDAQERDALLSGSAATSREQATLKPEPAPKGRLWHAPDGIYVLMLATGIISTHCIMFEEVYPLFAAADFDRGVGLSFEPRQIAFSLTFVGPAVFIAQLIVYPLLNARFHTIQLWKVSALIFAMDYPLVSLVPAISNGVLRQVLLVVLLCIRSSMVIVGWTSLNILTNQIADPAHRGFTTSIVQASASFGRAVGPSVGGTLWSWCLNNGYKPPFDFHLFFVTVALLAALQYTTASWIPKTAATMN